MNCSHFSGELSADDMEFLTKMLQRHKAKVMLTSWVKMGQLKIPGGHGVDRDKARVAEILRRQVWCWKEKTFISAADEACYAWQPQK